MATLVQAGSTVEFTPDPSWAWFGFDGCVDLATSQTRASYQSDGFITADDFKDLERLLIGKKYTAVGFDDIPGAVRSARVLVDEPTLSDRLLIEDKSVATSETTGTFTIEVISSFRAGSPPIKAPLQKHAGTWNIRTPKNNDTVVPG